MTDVRTVFTTAEVAQMLEISPGYVLRLAKSMKLSEMEMRQVGKRNYLFNKEAIEKMRKRNQ